MNIPLTVVFPHKASCIDFLSKTNYYRLSGYYLPFIKKDTEKCFIMLNFERIQNIYIFDIELRNLISLAIEKIETHIRTQLVQRKLSFWYIDAE